MMPEETYRLNAFDNPPLESLLLYRLELWAVTVEEGIDASFDARLVMEFDRTAATGLPIF